MRTHRHNRGRFAATAILAAVALFFGVLSAPAAADVDPPEDVNIKGLLKGGQIHVHDYQGDPFPLGEKEGGPSDVCDKYDEGRTQFNAYVDSSSTADDFEFNFVQGSADLLAGGFQVCVLLEIDNEEDLVGETTGKNVEVTDGASGGAEVSVSVILKNPDTGVENFRCTTSANTGPLEGEWLEPKLEEYPEKKDWDWNLELSNVQTFNVPGVQSTGLFTGPCPSLVAGQVNSALGLSGGGSDTDVDFKWIVYDCDKPTAWEGCDKS